MSIIWTDGLKRHDIYIDGDYVGFVKIKKNDFKGMTEMEASIKATDDANLWLAASPYDYHVEIYIFSIADENYALMFSHTNIPLPNFTWDWWDLAAGTPIIIE